MKSLVLSVFLSLSPLAAFADCESMWVTRNMLFDRAGYCFGSNLGKAIFDNSNCTGKQITLPAWQQDFVSYTKAMERDFQCNIDTSRRSLDLPLLSQWLQLIDPPRRGFGESGCAGYLGEPLNLRSAVGGGRVLGQIVYGDDILFAHDDIGDSTFVTTMRNGRPVALGWVQINFSQMKCTSYAG